LTFDLAPFFCQTTARAIWHFIVVGHNNKNKKEVLYAIVFGTGGGKHGGEKGHPMQVYIHLKTYSSIIYRFMVSMGCV
jgi:hypothetical protein